MKKNEIQELKRMPLQALQKLLAEKQEKLRLLKLDLAMGKSTQLKDLRELKKTVARIKTFINAHAEKKQ
jgi:ribosomal protein L29